MAATDFTSAGRVASLFDADSAGAASSLQGNELDTKGWRWLHISVNLGTVAATSDGSITIQQSDTSGSGYVDITGAAFTILPTDDNTVLHGVIDLEQMDRYIRTAGTTGAAGTTDIAIVGVLYGCVNTAEYIDQSSGGADELAFRVLFE